PASSRSCQIKTCSAPSAQVHTFEYLGNHSALSHLIGKIDGTGWSVKSTDGSSVMSYGPYATHWPQANYDAIFTLSVDNVSADNHKVATLDVFDFTSSRVIASMDVYRKDFKAVHSAQ